MLAPGHLATGYLISMAVIKLLNPPVAAEQLSTLILVGMLAAIAPDIDLFKFYYHDRKKGETSLQRHREYLTHAPVLWLIAGLGIFLISNNPVLKYSGLLIWLGSWSHFLMDSFEVGIMWKWPLSKKRHALRPVVDLPIQQSDKVFRHFLSIMRKYMRSITFYAEVLVIVAAILVYALQ